MLFFIYGIRNVYLIYLFPFILVKLSFRGNFYSYIKAIILYYLINYSLGGVTLTLNISSNIYYLITLLIISIIFMFVYIFYRRKDIDITYRISFKFRDRLYSMDAFYDTGCNLFYKGYPVIILNKKYHFMIYTDLRLTYYSGDIETEKELYLINELKLNHEVIKCYCIFLDINYEAIIGSNLL